ncbi:tail fiber protein [Escherichia coli]|nr:phage tail protein [Escherichia coli]EHY2712083.1 tail fiber protein [Escherichia coli]EHY2785316.1 tail fiber protein [Escherichia coli]
MAKNDFKAFATDRNANVISQEEWEALPALLSGFTAGKASSAQVNKVIRQASFIAAALAQYTANKSGLDVLDDGDLNGFISKMGTAFGKDFQALDATLTALAGLETGANKLPYFTGNDTAAQTDLTSVGRDIIGKKTIADILTYLGLGEGSALPVGVPVPWPSATPPTGWLKCNGAAFSAEEYPELAKAYPTNKLPDLRGEFIRGWDDGRGMDTGRAILSAQGDAIRNIYGEFKTVNTENYSIWESVGSFKGAVVPLNPSTNNSYFSLIRSMVTERTDGAVYPKVIGLDASRIVPTANENRPRNIAFNYIVRAA